MTPRLRDLGRLIIALAVGGVLLSGYTTVRIWQQGEQDETRPADAIVVLGAAQYDGSPSPVLRARLDHAIDLFRLGVAPTLVVTGGKLQADRTTEASAARAYAVKHGISDAVILIEDRGTSTLESLDSVAAIMRAHGMRSAVFVSDRTHMLRVLRIALDHGIVAWGSPTTTSPTDATLPARTEATVHELGGLATWFLGGHVASDGIAPGAR